jgi:hypothetical protein
MWMNSYGLVPIALPFVLGSCTLLSDFDVHECTESSDCVSALGAFGRCEQARCVSAGCSSNADCVAADPRFPLCQSAGGRCVALITEGSECPASTNYNPASMGALTAEDLILIGVFAPSIRSSAGLSLTLATDELNALGGLPGPRGPRPLLAVQCDASRASAALPHLVNDLKVTGILAGLDADALRSVVSDDATSEPAFFLSPGGSHVRPSELSANGEYLWYLGAEYRDAVPTYEALLARLSAYAQSAPAAPPSKLASISSRAAEDEKLESSVFQALELDGSNAAALADQDRFLSFELSDDPEADRKSVLEPLLTLRPNIVLSFAGGVYGEPARRERATLFRALAGVAEGDVAFAPFYVLGPRNIDDVSPARLAFEDPAFAGRALAVRAGRAQDPALGAALDARFREAFPEAESLGFRASPQVYDGIYYLAYASAASPPSSPGGRAAATQAGLSRVTDGSAARIVVGPGPNGLEQAMTLLASATPFNLAGTDGPAEFDLGQHARPGQGHVYCWGENGELRDLATFDGASGFTLTADPCGQEIANVFVDGANSD